MKHYYATGGDGIPAELFQILKDDAVKVLHSICQQTENSAVATGLEKVSFHSNPKEGQCQKMFKVKVKSLSRVQLFVTPWIAAHQAPPSIEFSRQEYWSGLPLNYHTIVLISHASKVMFKILQARLQQYVN